MKVLRLQSQPGKQTRDVEQQHTSCYSQTPRSLLTVWAGSSPPPHCSRQFLLPCTTPTNFWLFPIPVVKFDYWFRIGFCWFRVFGSVQKKSTRRHKLDGLIAWYCFLPHQTRTNKILMFDLSLVVTFSVSYYFIIIIIIIRSHQHLLFLPPYFLSAPLERIIQK